MTRRQLGRMLWVVLLVVAAHSADCQDPPPRPLAITVLEVIDVGDVMVSARSTSWIEMATDGRRESSLGQPVFGSLPYGAGRLRLLGQREACVRLTAHPAGRSADSGRLRVLHVSLQAANARGQEELYLRLDRDGLAFVDVGLRLQLSSIEQSDAWRLSLTFEAQYDDECLDE
jgi:hypothetical protein